MKPKCRGMGQDFPHRDWRRPAAAWCFRSNRLVGFDRSGPLGDRCDRDLPALHDSWREYLPTRNAYDMTQSDRQAREWH